METRTITHLNSKPWYRALKVLNGVFVFCCYSIAVASAVAIWVNEGVLFDSQVLSIILKILYTPWALFWGWLMSNIPQWLFYYIYFGSLKPQK
jgi:uncharacterized membrane-anchored protein YitT (DUF2179 family)